MLLIPAPASAYLDPSAGSMVFQMTVGGLLAAAAAIRLYWKNLRNVFRGGGSGSSKPEAESDE
jgi:hypothetical protein